ncbi:putative quinol monooxygenase [Emcibacter sp.]|uniref:putative quinol monooxygenase n=1 Tax=Emcibacter sp. TaxID=1979954 RepID=UPI002AA68621|nr:putative quinol monooxygenase [Emcibacter sp.]
MIVITGTIKTDKETLPALYARLKELVEPSRAEDGCLFYHMAMEDEKGCSIVAMEGWRDQAALEVHLAQPAIVKLLSDFDGKYSNDVSLHQVSSTQKF